MRPTLRHVVAFDIAGRGFYDRLGISLQLRRRMAVVVLQNPQETLIADATSPPDIAELGAEHEHDDQRQ
jgi:hypothetical protein